MDLRDEFGAWDVDCSAQFWTGRGGTLIAENIFRSYEKVGIKNFVIVTTHAKCYSRLVEDVGVSHVLLFNELFSIFPRCGDRQSEFRLVLIHEILRRGFNVINVDPDVIFFRALDKHLLDSDIGFSLNPERQDVTLELIVSRWRQHFNTGTMICFGFWYGRSSVLPLFRAAMKTAILGEFSANRCDDQHGTSTWLGQNMPMFSQISFQSNAFIQEGGRVRIRYFSPDEVTMAERLIRGNSILGTSSALHMASYGPSKEWGLRELGLFFVDPVSYYNITTCLVLPNCETCSSHEQELVGLKNALRLSTSWKVPLILPRFNCRWVPFASLVHHSQKWCPWNFYYEWHALKEAFEIRESAFLSSSHAAADFARVPLNIESLGLEEKTGKGYAAKVAYVLENAWSRDKPLTHLDAEEEFGSKFKAALKENSRVHGCC